jgi:polyhydroxyalkanoate synthase
LNSDLLRWSPSLRPRASEIAAAAAEAPEAFRAALEKAVLRRSIDLLEAISRYREHPYERDLPDPPVLWREGTTRLLDFGRAKPGGPPVLLVPSLINRGYILDLSSRCSLARWLAGEGFHPLLVDWDAPGEIERGFNLTDYIAGRLEGALDAVLEATGRAPLLAGYCMGGLLALGLALRRQRDLASLALLATPWDFSACAPGQGAAAQAALLTFAPAMDLLGELPLDAIQSLFAAIDPENGARKFLMFSRMDPAGSRAESFVALEDWLNDGVPLAAPVARECLGGWYARNTTAAGLWRIAGRPVLPAKLDLPSLCVIPETDRIVPPESALALGRAIPGAELLRPPLGHIGMVASGRARELAWQPLAAWLRERG